MTEAASAVQVFFLTALVSLGFAVVTYRLWRIERSLKASYRKGKIS